MKNLSLLPNFLLLTHIKGCSTFDTTITLDIDKLTELIARGRVTSVELSLFPPTLVQKRMKYAFAHIPNVFETDLIFKL